MNSVRRPDHLFPDLAILHMNLAVCEYSNHRDDMPL